jgi:hypothetical protein
LLLLSSSIRLFQDGLISEYQEVNQAAQRLLTAYTASLMSATNDSNHRLSMNINDKQIDAYSTVPSNTIENNNNEKSLFDRNTLKKVDESETEEIDDINNNEIKLDIDQANRTRFDYTHSLVHFRHKIHKQTTEHVLLHTSVYTVGCLLLICTIIGIFVLNSRYRRYRYTACTKNNGLFTGIDSCTPEEKMLHALQINGYENPTYKFFESQNKGLSKGPALEICR